MSEYTRNVNPFVGAAFTTANGLKPSPLKDAGTEALSFRQQLALAICASQSSRWEPEDVKHNAIILWRQVEEILKHERSEKRE